jgi:serine/threonine-protein kinase
VSSSLQEQLQLALGDTYLLERELGGGGMSRVFVAHERALGRKVVVKVLLPELAAAVNVDRFRREIQLAAQLQHPHIVPLLSAGEANGLPYFIMPFVSGESLRARITREGEFPIADTVHILRDVVSALAYAHAHGVVHRDVKPDNVLLSHGVAVVTDFGVAKALSASSGASGSGITSAGVALGTPAYMAPEQATASPNTDHRADIYALGAMAYELLTGSTPFAGRSLQATLAAQVIEQPEPVERRRPAVPPMLAAMVRECLCKRPADRPQSAQQVMHVLDAIATPSGGTAATTAVRPRAVSPHGAGPRKWLAASGVALALILAGGVLWFRSQSAPSDTGEAIAAGPSLDSATAAVQIPASDSLEAQGAPKPRAAETTGDPVTSPRPRRTTVPTPPVTLRPEQPAEPLAAAAAREDSSPVDSSPVTGGLAAVPAPAPPTVSSSLPVAAPPPTPTVPPPAAPKTPPVPADQRPAIRTVIGEYAAAIESRSLQDLRRVYPGMTSVQQRGWEQFFQLVRDVEADLSLTQLVVSGGSAEGQITGAYTYLNTSTGRAEHQPVSFRASFKSDGGKWRLVQVR